MAETIRDRLIDKLADEMDRENAAAFVVEFEQSITPRCDQCRFWRRHSSSGGTPAPGNDILRWGECARNDCVRDRSTRCAETRADFGCVQWERNA